MSQESIYVVWNPAGNAPTVRHPSVEQAREEARRLALANPHAEFFVLRAVESVQYRTDPFVCKTYCRS